MINHREESMRIGHNLKKIRLQRGLTQMEVSADTNLNRSYIGRIEAGKARVTIALLEQLVKGLEITSRDLI